MEEKNADIHELKRKNCELVEIKRRLEEALDAYEFELNSSRERYEADVKERSIRLENMERSLKEISHTHSEEIKLLQ